MELGIFLMLLGPRISPFFIYDITIVATNSTYEVLFSFEYFAIPLVDS